MRKLPIRPGMLAWVDYPSATSGDASWPHGTKVRIVSADGRNRVVRTADGREGKLPHYVLSTGWEFRGRSGRYVPESDARVLDWLVKQVLKLKLESWDPAVEADREAVIAGYLRILRRNDRTSL